MAIDLKLEEEKLLNRIKDAKRDFLFEVEKIRKERDEIIAQSRVDDEKNELDNILKNIKKLT